MFYLILSWTLGLFCIGGGMRSTKAILVTLRIGLTSMFDVKRLLVGLHREVSPNLESFCLFYLQTGFGYCFCSLSLLSLGSCFQ